MKFELKSSFSPTGDQPEAIADLVQGVKDGVASQTLLGVTGSGKTFTVANVIQEVERPTLVLCHNKTLAAQLYQEFKSFFPNNAVEYFVSYYDYYQPEAYLPSSDTYIEKDLSINDDIEKLKNSVNSTFFDKLKDYEKKNGFSEAIQSKKEDKKIPFFYLGPKNDWRKILDKKIETKINKAFPAEFKELGYE